MVPITNSLWKVYMEGTTPHVANRKPGPVLGRDRHWSGREMKLVMEESVVKCQKEKDLGSMRKKNDKKDLF